MMKKLIYFVLAVLSSHALADAVTNLSELALLPPSCRGTQLIRDISKDPKPLEEYYAMYGMSYSHYHHYCWALNTENHAWKTHDAYMRKSMLGYALGDLQYSLDHSDSNFIFLPDIYNTKARILFSLHRDAEAVLALSKAIEVKPDFIPAIARLSDYYAEHGDKAHAIKTLENGIDQTEKAGTLIKKLKRLGKTYSGTPGNARKKEAAAIEPAVLGTAPTQPGTSAVPLGEGAVTTTGTTQPASAAPQEGKPANPYCRFCP